MKLTIQVTLKGDIPMEYRIEKREKFSFYGMTKRFSTVGGANFKEIPAFWEEVSTNGRFDALMKTRKTPLCLGVCMPMDHEKEEEFDYVIGVFGEGKPEGYSYYEVAEAEWAVFDVNGPIHPNLQDTWKRIFSEWFPQNEYKHAPLPEFELYEDGDVASEDYHCEVWIPIER